MLFYAAVMVSNQFSLLRDLTVQKADQPLLPVSGFCPS
jgi:hypothetical protein